MKKVILLIIILSTYVFPQEWLAPRVFGNEPELKKMDLFTNSEANFLVVQDVSSNIEIYKFNSTGILYQHFPITLDTDSEFPSITGNNNKLYVTYRTGDKINTKFSNDGGSIWSSLIPYSVSQNICSGVDNAFDEETGLHFVWSLQDNGDYFKTYYLRYDINNILQTVEYKEVSDLSLTGAFPTIALSPGRIHVSFDHSNSSYPFFNINGPGRERTKESGSWLFYSTVASYSGSEKLAIYDDKLFCFYFEPLRQYFQFDLKLKYREFSQPFFWNTINFSASTVDISSFIGVAATKDGKLHFIYDDDWTASPPEDPTSIGIVHQIFDGDSFSYPVTITNADLTQLTNLSMSYVSNDLYLVYQEEYDNNFTYSHYDAAPLTPENFNGTTYNNHPKLTWTLNNEPDMSGYEIYRLLTGGSGVYELLTTVSASTSSFVDNGVQLGGPTAGKVFYKIRAKDNHPYYSAYTNAIIYTYSGLNKLTVENQSIEYGLSANYPNPFNPSTQISYSLAQDAFVTIKVYDMLGTEVAELVNETQGAGNHTINFNAEHLSSGVYIYRITASNNGRTLFKDSKQMILLR